MLQECYYEWIPFDEEGKLVECVESICIALGKYPLNVDGNPAISDQWHDYLLEKRKLKESSDASYEYQHAGGPSSPPACYRAILQKVISDVL